MNFAIDSRGIKRGRCLQCNCSNYRAPTASTGHKCLVCDHPPTKHERIPDSNHAFGNSPSHQPSSLNSAAASRPQSYAAAASTDARYTSAQQRSYGVQHGGYATSIHSQYQEPGVTNPITRPCKAQDCYKLSHYDPRVGEFEYCSPGCRDRDLLPKERKRLNDDLQAFENSVKQLAQKETSGKPLLQGQTKYSSASTFYGASTASRQDNLAQGQKTMKLMFQKTPSEDIGFIIASEEYRQHAFTGILILGFEFGTKAERLIRSGEVHLLDVITFLNEKKANHFNYHDEVRKGACTLVLNRSIALPEINRLMDKAKASNPTHLVAVMNPKDIPDCSTVGFGFDAADNYISSASENSPARFSMLNFGEEIVAFGFAKDSQLEIGTGYVKLIALDKAAADGKTAILVLKK